MAFPPAMVTVEPVTSTPFTSQWRLTPSGKVLPTVSASSIAKVYVPEKEIEEFAGMTVRVGAAETCVILRA